MILWIKGRGGRKVKTKGGASAMISPEMDKAMQKAGVNPANMTKSEVDAMRANTHPVSSTNTKPTKETKSPSPTTSTKPSNKPIQDLNEFDSEMKKIVEEYQKKEGTDDPYIPIHEVRARFGDRISREEFDRALGEMQGADKFQLIGGEMPGITNSQLEGSYVNQMGKLKYYIQPNFQGTSMDNKIKNTKIKKTEPYPTSKISSAKDFEAEITHVVNRLNKEYPQKDGYIAIAQVRQKMKGRLSDQQFDNWLFEAQGNDKIELSKGETSLMSAEDRKGGVKTAIGTERHYIQVL